MRRTISISDFRNNLKAELTSINEEDEPILVKRPKGQGNIVVLSEAAFSSLEETGYLLSTEANRTHLKKSMEDLKAGRVTKMPLKKLWK
jgi:antitoxin YefM